MSGYVAVVGGVNIDIGGRPFSPLVPRDSNPGRVTVSLGGVGRNIAHNLSLLGAEVQLLTAFGDDVYAMQIEAGCAPTDRRCRAAGGNGAYWSVRTTSVPRRISTGVGARWEILSCDLSDG